MCTEVIELSQAAMVEQIDSPLCPYDPQPVDKKERKRYQNRLAQRTYRRNQKQRLRELEEAVEQARKKSTSPMPSEHHDSAYLDSRLRGEDFSLFPASHELQQQQAYHYPSQSHHPPQQQRLQDQQYMNFVPYTGMPSPLMDNFSDKGTFDSLPDLVTPPGTPLKVSCTALHRAVCNGSAQMIRLLLKRGADIRLQNSNGQTALHVAVELGREDAVRALLEGSGGARNNPNVVDAFGRTPLFQAVQTEHEGIARLLIEASIDINYKDLMGETALHLAVDRGSEKLTCLLLEAGADIDA